MKKNICGNFDKNLPESFMYQIINHFSTSRESSVVLKQILTELLGFSEGDFSVLIFDIMIYLSRRQLSDAEGC